MSAANKDAQFSINALPFRQGALSAKEIRRKCPQFRILIIGKANAGKTTILRKVCNAKPDANPTVYDAEGKMVQQASTNVAPTAVSMVILRILQSWGKKTNKIPGSSDSRGSCRFFTGRRDILQISPTLPSTHPLIFSILQRRLSKPKPFIIISDDLSAWRT